jgi:FkbM family methyltransferase
MKAWNRGDLPVILRLAEFASCALPQSVKRAIYHFPLFSGLIRKQLNSFAPSGLTELVIASGVLRGVRLKLDLKSEKQYWLGTYEPDLLQAIHDFCGEGMVAYDVGANIGYISLVFSRTVGENGHVFAFEPLPANTERIAQHVSINSLQNVIHLVPCAVSDCEGNEIFLVRGLAGGKVAGSVGRDYIYTDRIQVCSLRLDDFVYQDGNPCPNVIKMDIEGGGVKAIPGMQRVLSEGRPILFVELHGSEEQQVVLDALAQNNYSTHRMQNGYPELNCDEALSWKEFVVALP